MKFLKITDIIGNDHCINTIYIFSLKKSIDNQKNTIITTSHILNFNPYGANETSEAKYFTIEVNKSINKILTLIKSIK